MESSLKIPNKYQKFWRNNILRRRKMRHIYEDEFVKVTDYNITVKNYHFPSKKDRTIAIENISVVYFEEQESCKYSTTRTWGKAVGSIWWALDFKRDLHCLPGVSASRSNVVIDIGTDPKLGFTVDDIDAFMDCMRNILDYHVIIVNKINL